MLSILSVVDLFLHIDKYLVVIATDYGPYIYALLFIIIFFETGIVITPFLPGDSLLFAAGALAGVSGDLNIWFLFIIISLAAVIGDSVNYSIGRYAGRKAFENKDSKIFKKEYLDRTEAFYEIYGDRAIFLGRFFPIIRTFIPFVAGIGEMPYRRFIVFNILGGVVWSGIFLFGGYFFGNIQVVKEHFSTVVFGIIILSLVPAIYHIFASRNKNIS